MHPNFSLSVDLYELTMAQCYYFYKKNTLATFELFVRDLPQNRNYLVACGLEDILGLIKNLRFGKEEILFLKSLNRFSTSFLDYLSKLRFSGDVWAMPEGTIFFPNQPIIRVTAPIIEAQLLESFFLNSINLQTMIASKAARCVCAAQGKDVFDFSLRRTHGPEAAVKVARSSYIVGCAGTSNVLAAKNYSIPAVGTMAHSFVMSFSNELESFSAYAYTFPQATILLVDTYDTLKGIDNAIRIGKQLKKKGYLMVGIRLDSGDILRLSKLARKKLDAAGLSFVKIFASGNLDEFKIKNLLSQGACIDSFGVGTNMGTSSDAPYLDVIYKLCEITDKKGNFLPTMKLSKGKVTYPGRKQVFRIQDAKGRYQRDILALEGESFAGKPLLVKVVEKGKIVYSFPSLPKIREYFKQEKERFLPDLFSLDSRYVYPLKISFGLEGLRKRLSGQLKKRQ